MQRGAPIEPPTPAEIERAAEELRDVVLETPLVPLRDADEDVWLKLETLQAVGSTTRRFPWPARGLRVASRW